METYPWWPADPRRALGVHPTKPLSELPLLRDDLVLRCRRWGGHNRADHDDYNGKKPMTPILVIDRQHILWLGGKDASHKIAYLALH